MKKVYNVGCDELRNTRIKKLEELFYSLKLEFKKEDEQDEKVIYKFKHNYSNKELYLKEIELQRAIIKDSLLITTLGGYYSELEDEYYNTLIQKSINNEILYPYSACYHMLQGKTVGIFSHDHIQLMQFLLNKKLIKCTIIDKKYTPKEFIRKITKNKFITESFYGRLRRYKSEEHKITVLPVKISPLFIVSELISGQKCISYTTMHPYAICYEASEGFLKYMIEHKKELENITSSYQRNFNEAQNSGLVGF